MQNNSLGESDEVKAAHGNAYPESYPQLRVGSLWSVTSNGFGQFRTSDEEEQGRRRWLEQPAAVESGNESSGIGSGSGSELGPGPGPKSPLTSTSSIAVVVANPESNTVATSDTLTGTVNTVTSTVIIDDSFAEYRQFCANRMRRLERYKKARSFCSGLVQPGADEVGSAADSTLSSLAATSLRGPLPGPAGLSSGPLNSTNPRRGRWRPASLVVMGAGDSLEGLELQKLAQVQAQAQAQAQAHQFGINLVPRCPEPPPQPPQPSQSAYGPILSADFPPPPLFCGSSVETRELSGMHVPERSGSSSGYSSGPSSALSSYSGSASSWATQEPPKQPREQGKAQIEVGSRNLGRKDTTTTGMNNVNDSINIIYNNNYDDNIYNNVYNNNNNSNNNMNYSNGNNTIQANVAPTSQFDLIRDKMISLMENDVQLLQQLLALGDSIQQLKRSNSQTLHFVRENSTSDEEEWPSPKKAQSHSCLTTAITNLYVEDQPNNDINSNNNNSSDTDADNLNTANDNRASDIINTTATITITNNTGDNDNNNYNSNIQYFSRKNSVLRIPIPPRSSNRSTMIKRMASRLSSVDGNHPKLFSPTSPNAITPTSGPDMADNGRNNEIITEKFGTGPNLFVGANPVQNSRQKSCAPAAAQNCCRTAAALNRGAGGGMMVAYTEGEEGDGGQGAGGGRLSIRSYGSTGSSVDSSPSPTFLQYTPAPGEQHAHAATHPLNGLHHSAHQNILLNAAASGKCK